MDTFEDRFEHEPTNEDWDVDDLDENDPNVMEYTYTPNVYKGTKKTSKFNIKIFILVFVLLIIAGGVLFFLKSDNSRKTITNLVQKGKDQTVNLISNFTKGEERPKVAPETTRYKLNNITKELQNVATDIKQEFSNLTEEKQEDKKTSVSNTTVNSTNIDIQRPSVIRSQNATITKTPQSQKSFNLPGRGKLPDFKTAIQKNPELKDFLVNADVYSFEKLNEFRPFVQKLIKKWAQTDDLDEIEKIIGMKFETFTTLTEVNLLPFTTLKKVGLTPSYDSNLIKENAHEASGTFYMNLQPILDNISDIDTKLDYVEPLSDFLIYHCARKQQCMVEWDTLIELLGLSEYKKELLTP